MMLLNVEVDGESLAYLYVHISDIDPLTMIRGGWQFVPPYDLDIWKKTPAIFRTAFIRYNGGRRNVFYYVMKGG